MSNHDDSVEPTISTITFSRPNELRISVNLIDAGIKSAHPTTIRHISVKAEELLGKASAITNAPTSNGSEAFMVESESMVKPHYVTVAKNGKVSCNYCPGWNAYKISSHALAVAEHAGKTSEYFKCLRLKGPQQMNLTSLITYDSNKGVGKKGRKSSTVRRKGGRSSNKAPPTTITDRDPCSPAADNVLSSVPATEPFRSFSLPLPNVGLLGTSTSANERPLLRSQCPNTTSTSMVYPPPRVALPSSP